MGIKMLLTKSASDVPVGVKRFWVAHVGGIGYSILLVLVITCLGSRFGINCPSAFLKILKLPKSNEGNFKIFKNHEGDLSQQLPEPNM